MSKKIAFNNYSFLNPPSSFSQPVVLARRSHIRQRRQKLFVSKYHCLFFFLSDFHPPLYYLVLKAWSSVFGYSEFSLRLPSVIFFPDNYFSSF